MSVQITFEKRLHFHALITLSREVRLKNLSILQNILRCCNKRMAVQFLQKSSNTLAKFFSPVLLRFVNQP